MSSCPPHNSELSANSCSMPGTTEVVLSLLDAPANGRVLGLGCYHGDVSLHLQQRGFQVSSCDLVAYEGKERLADFRVDDANQPLPYCEAAFNAILCTDVIEHLENPARVRPRAAAGGKLVLSTPNVSGMVSRVAYLLRGEFPLFRRYHFDNWNHISPVSVLWIEATAQRFGMSVERVCSERGAVSLKRWAIYAASALARPLLGRQRAAFETGHSAIVRLRRMSTAARTSGNGDSV